MQKAVTTLLCVQQQKYHWSQRNIRHILVDHVHKLREVTASNKLCFSFLITAFVFWIRQYNFGPSKNNKQINDE